jgi:multisubunit Na+/H+ antiporter MnhF subunit
MFVLVLNFCYIGLFVSVLLSLIRFIKGPSALDRILAFDAIALSAAALAILFSIQTASVYFIELLLIFSLLGFVTVLGYIDYLSQIKKETSEEHHDVE